MNLSLSSYIIQLGNNPLLWVITVLIVGVIFVNGLNDSPNSITTCVATRSLTPKKALLMAAICSFLGIFIMSMVNTSVAETVFKIADFGNNTNNSLVALCATMISIVVWAFLAWRIGIPTSQSHSLIAGLIGANIAIVNGWSGINFSLLGKVLFGLIISTILGFLIGFLVCKLFQKVCKYIDRRKTVPFFKSTQIIGDAAMSFMDGAQDGQKFLAIFILGICLSNGTSNSGGFTIPIWMILLCSTIVSIGTCIGGPRIIKNIGMKMVKIESYQGTAADISGFTCLLFSSLTGIPLSSGQTKTTATMGVSAAKRWSSVDWGIAKNLIIAWLVTFPCCGILGYLLTELFLKIF